MILYIWNLLGAVWIYLVMTNFIRHDIFHRNRHYLFWLIWNMKCWCSGTTKQWSFLLFLIRSLFFLFYLTLTLVRFWNFRTFLIKFALDFFEPSNLWLMLLWLANSIVVWRMVVELSRFKSFLMITLLIFHATRQTSTSMCKRLHNEPSLNGGQTWRFPGALFPLKHKFWYSTV